MTYFKVFVALLLLFSLAPPSLAKVYTWTDEKGVKHFSNVAPPDSAKDLRDAEEIPAEPAGSGPEPGDTESAEPAGSEPEPTDTEPTEASPQRSPQGNRQINEEARAVLEQLKSKGKTAGQTTPPADESASEEIASEEPAPDESTPEESANGESAPEESAPADDQALSQGEIVANEKAHVKQLQTELENDPGQRDTFITSEKERLMQTLEEIRQMPTSQFGSSRNKDRRLGYYQYRLDALQNNPDTYFEYGDSASD